MEFDNRKKNRMSNGGGMLDDFDNEMLETDGYNDNESHKIQMQK